MSYRNQSIDLQTKSMFWFLYDNGLCHERVNQTSAIVDKQICLKYVLNPQCTLRKKSPYSEFFWSTFFLHFPAIGLNTERWQFPKYDLYTITFIKEKSKEFTGTIENQFKEVMD